jgi:erythronate-4-phosphate dehydrogenase
VKFVGTATIGTDHVDLDYLKRRGIAFASAPGSNANSVAEYIVAALLVLARSLGFSLEGTALGVVGVGNVGSKVVQKAEVLGMHVLQNDPPLQRLTGEKRFLPLDDLMAADVVTLHVPLSRDGTDPTFHFYDETRIGRMKPGSILINTSRGAVVDTASLKRALRSGHLKAAVIDVWENEPDIDVDLLGMVTIGTSHIAGYSLDGKFNAVRMISDALGEHVGERKPWPETLQLPPIVDLLSLSPERGWTREELLLHAVRPCYDIERDDRVLREILHLEEAVRPRLFRALRAEYPPRREFPATTIAMQTPNPVDIHMLNGIGFKVADWNPSSPDGLPSFQTVGTTDRPARSPV